MKLNLQDYRNKVLGCWLGKNIGGTLGAPFEWKRQVNNVSFYTQDLHGDPLPNDDLDIQLLWLVAMEEKGIEVDAHRLAEYWCLYVAPHWAEYGTGKINMRAGLLPPLSGSYRNAFKHSCGSFIRSEIWACITPGLPHLAAQFAYEDAILDHGNGEGTYAEIFIATLESAAFIISDLRQLIDIGLSFIPKECGVAQAIRTTLACKDGGKTWLEARDEALRLYRGGTFFGHHQNTSLDDQKKGFLSGELGYDVPTNIAITLIGLLYGGEDFGQVQCIAVNCGEDTDCTAATAGSIWGIIHGAAKLPKKWTDPIGRGIKTVCLNLGDLHSGNQLPQTVDDLTERTLKIARQVFLRHGVRYLSDTEPTDLSDINSGDLKSEDQGASLYRGLGGPRFDFDFFTVYVDYGDEPVLRDGQPKIVKVTIQNRYKVQAQLGLHWYLPETLQVSPSADGSALSVMSWLGKPLALEFTLNSSRQTQPVCRAVMEITVNSRPNVMLIPITLLNGNYDCPAHEVKKA